jgi:hypothetical protein
MKITIEPTTKIVELITASGKVPARIWEGTTERGTPLMAFITRIAPLIEGLKEGEPADLEFKAALGEVRAPSREVQAIDARLIL